MAEEQAPGFQATPCRDVFISYASRDAALANDIVETLERNGLRCWIAPRDVTPGAHYADAIILAISGAKCVVLVLSDSALGSKHVGKEIERASSKGRPIIALRTTAAPLPPAFEYFLSESQWIDVGAGGVATATVKLAEAIRSHSDSAVATGPVGVPAAVSHAEPVPLRRWMISALVVVVAVLFGYLVANKLWLSKRIDEQQASAEVTPASRADSSAALAITDKSIAVLPFVDMSEKKDQDYFSDGIAEELLNLLARIPELRVIARTSSFSYKGKEIDIAEIAKKLNVAHVLEGSVRKSGRRLRITAQLVRTSDSTQLWSQSFDRPLDDIFAVQDEIAAAVVEQLKIKLLGAVPKVRKSNPEAYALFLQALQQDRQYTQAGMEQSISLYQQALAVDPTYTAAWNGLAGVYVNQAYLGLGPRSADEGFRLARETANKTLAIDPDYARAHGLLGWIAMEYDDDLASAARHIEHALALDPTDPYSIAFAAELLLNLGHQSAAIELQEYVAARDPVNPGGHADLAFDYYVAGRLEDAIISCRSVLALAPDNIGVHYRIGVSLLLRGDGPAALKEMQAEPDEGWRLTGLALVYHALGKNVESNAALAELIGKHEKSWSSSVAWVLAFRGESDAAFVWMDKAVAYHDTGVVHFPIEPLLTNLHSDPRWPPFLRKIGKVPEQLAAIKFEVKLPQ